jgi:hypothetical protein
MGLFSKKQQEPLTYAEVERTVHVPARLGDVVAHLAAYGELWSRKRAEPHEVMVAEVGGWTAVRLPEAVHPWQLHNLGYWMLDCPNSGEGLVCESGAGPGHVGYRLVRDPEVADALCGWDTEGSGWTVRVPDHRIVRGEDVPVPRSFVVPTGHQDWRPVQVLFEDPGRGMNETNSSNGKSRSALGEHDLFPY